MSKSEKKLIEECLYSENSTLFRNDNGMGYRKNGRQFRYGLLSGSGDLIGWEKRIITPAMVDKKIAIFKSVEIKTITDTISFDQLIWYYNVIINGGIASVYTENGLLTTEEVLRLPRRKEPPSAQIAKEKILKVLTETLQCSNL